MTTFFLALALPSPVGQGGKARFGHFYGFLGLIPKQRLANPRRDSAEKTGPLLYLDFRLTLSMRKMGLPAHAFAGRGGGLAREPGPLHSAGERFNLNLHSEVKMGIQRRGVAAFTPSLP